MATSNKLKAYVRFDGSGRVVPSSVILARFKPKVGNYQEIASTECCEYIPTTTTTSTTTTGDTIVNWALNTFAACGDPVGTISITYDGPTLCTSTNIYGDLSTVVPMENGDFLIGYGGQFSVWNLINSGQAISVVPCGDCPIF